LGTEYCNTEGSTHYKNGDIEPIDLYISKDIHEDFFLGSIIKYASRFKVTRNINDLKKIADYAHLLCGVEIDKKGLIDICQSQKQQKNTLT
jgi:hypothetical protein